jgi:hypothetical protein
MVTSTRITAVFPTADSCEAAVKDLRAQGVSDDRLGVIKHHNASAGAAMAAGATEGLLAGGAIGAAFGLASVLIPGVGPFIAAGFLAPTLGAIGGAAATGAIVGGSAGLISGALARIGYTDKESAMLAKELEHGQVVLVIDSGAAIDDMAVATIIAQHGGKLFAAVP